MFYRIFNELPPAFSDQKMQLKFENAIAAYFKTYSRYPRKEEDDYRSLMREAVFLSFRKVIKKNGAIKESLDHAMEAVDCKINEYIKRASEHPEHFELSSDQMVEIVERLKGQ